MTHCFFAVLAFSNDQRAREETSGTRPFRDPEGERKREKPRIRHYYHILVKFANEIINAILLEQILKIWNS